MSRSEKILTHVLEDGVEKVVEGDGEVIKPLLGEECLESRLSGGILGVRETYHVTCGWKSGMVNRIRCPE